MSSSLGSFLSSVGELPPSLPPLSGSGNLSGGAVLGPLRPGRRAQLKESSVAVLSPAGLLGPLNARSTRSKIYHVMKGKCFLCTHFRWEIVR